MESLIVCILIGVLLNVIGAMNMRGNISSLHRYHRKRVSEENRLPFGRLVGLGTILCGGGVLLFGAMNFVAERTQVSSFSTVGTVLLILSMVVGLGLNFYAMFKYNGGIF